MQEIVAQDVVQRHARAHSHDRAIVGLVARQRREESQLGHRVIVAPLYLSTVRFLNDTPIRFAIGGKIQLGTAPVQGDGRGSAIPDDEEVIRPIIERDFHSECAARHHAPLEGNNGERHQGHHRRGPGHPMED